ncbi:MAG: hypothetical protein IKT31_10255, partial [Firmicutes bacterium]|nr:hypothetical protein [Bacillota bacterium]
MKKACISAGSLRVANHISYILEVLCSFQVESLSLVTILLPENDFAASCAFLCIGYVDNQVRICFIAEADAAAGCMALTETINALLPEPVIENYVMIDTEGLTVLDGVESTEENS